MHVTFCGAKGKWSWPEAGSAIKPYLGNGAYMVFPHFGDLLSRQAPAPGGKVGEQLRLPRMPLPHGERLRIKRRARAGKAIKNKQQSVTILIDCNHVSIPP